MPKGVYLKKLGVHGKYARTLEIRHQTADSVRETSQKNAQDPEWRQKVSEATKERMRDPEVRACHLSALAEARRNSPTGSSWRGGQGDKPNDLELSYAWLLNLGYVSNFPVQVSRFVRYRLDYALPTEKICFEIDGQTHKSRQDKDAEKDSALRSQGWKVIRVRHWN